MFTILDNEHNISEVEFSTIFDGFCILGNAPFKGVATVLFEPKYKIVEYVSFQEWLRAYTETTHVTGESLVRHVYDALINELDPVLLEVSISGETQVHGPAIVTIRSYR